MENALALQGKFTLCEDCTQEMVQQEKNNVNQNTPCQKCSPIAMLKPKMNLVGSVPESTRAGVLQEIDVMMELQGLESSYFLKVTSATKLHLSDRGKSYFGKINNTPLDSLLTKYHSLIDEIAASEKSYNDYAKSQQAYLSTQFDRSLMLAYAFMPPDSLCLLYTSDAADE